MPILTRIPPALAANPLPILFGQYPLLPTTAMHILVCSLHYSAVVLQDFRSCITESDPTGSCGLRIWVHERTIVTWQFHAAEFVVFSSIVLIISLPTLTASGKRGAKYCWIFSNRSRYASKAPKETQSDQACRISVTTYKWSPARNGKGWGELMA